MSVCGSCRRVGSAHPCHQPCSESEGECRRPRAGESDPLDQRGATVDEAEQDEGDVSGSGPDEVPDDRVFGRRRRRARRVEKQEAVGPSDGKIRGSPVIAAARAMRPMEMNPFTRAKTPRTNVELQRRSSAGNCSRLKKPRATSDISPPRGLRSSIGNLALLGSGDPDSETSRKGDGLVAEKPPHCGHVSLEPCVEGRCQRPQLGHDDGRHYSDAAPEGGGDVG